VRVVATVCEVATHRRLRFHPVRAPARPFALLYVWFMLAGSAVTRRVRGDSILHTTGALVLNRADVSTVHFCHRAFHHRGNKARASRESRLYRLNGWVGARLSIAAEAWVYRPEHTRVMVPVSGGVASEMRRFFPRTKGHLAVIANAVDATEFQPDPAARERVRREIGAGHDRLLAVFVGGDWERKGLVYAIRALGFAPGWELLVVGPGDQEAARAQARAAGAEDRVHYTGQVATAAPCYAAGDAFVFPSAYEAAPMVLYEALASGLPVLSTRINGADELLRDGVNGWFVERDARAIGARLRELEGDHALRRSMGEAALQTVGERTWDAVVDAYQELYAGAAM
jgi:UDP-glucose:(heptosyl)LPS alpha-1,3-glucosyltransferase